MYRPLPKEVETRKSSIHGLGLFATEHIPKNTVLGITHVAHDLFPDGWIRTPLGGFYNHSEIPNCKLVANNMIGLVGKTESIWKDEGYLTEVKLLQTLKDIKKDTELTCTYTIWKATPEMKTATRKENWLGL